MPTIADEVFNTIPEAVLFGPDQGLIKASVSRRVRDIGVLSNDGHSQAIETTSNNSSSFNTDLNGEPVTMNSFTGTIEELQAIIADTGLDGDWMHEADRHTFKVKGKKRGVIIWYPSTMTLQFQGSEEAKASNIQKYESALGRRDGKPLLVRCQQPRTTAIPPCSKSSLFTATTRMHETNWN